jgi:hypothetical protein
MPIMRIARPFTWNDGTLPMWRFGVGVYDVDPAIATHPRVQWHTQEAVLARGGALIQHRVPVMHGNPGGAIHADGAMWVTDIEPGEIWIWTWPPGWSGFSFVDGLIEPAPDAIVFRMQPIEGQPGQFERVAERTPRYVPAGRFSTPLPVSGVEPPLLRFPAPARVGDVYHYGGAPHMPPVDHRSADTPEPDPQIAMLMRVQAEAVRAAQSKATC